METPTPFIIQTAIDYALPVEVVADIYEKYPNSFYAELELILQKRFTSKENYSK